jgi:Mg2+ and Co2+ transporter CorA
LKTADQNSIAAVLDSITEALSAMMEGMADETEEKETKINDKPTKPTKLMMEWPTAITALADDEESHADEAHSLQQLLASVFDGLWV